MLFLSISSATNSVCEFEKLSLREHFGVPLDKLGVA